MFYTAIRLPFNIPTISRPIILIVGEDNGTLNSVI